ncbi:MAG: ribonuclease J [Flexilinea sp.]
MKEKELQIIPLGGLGEVGRNMMLIGYQDRYIIIDCGVQFPDNSLIGVDYIIPDMQFLQGKEKKILGIILTHGHEDHIGGLPHLFDVIENVPIFATPLTAGMAEVKLARGGKLAKTKINIKNAGDVWDLGVFHIETFHMTHSIPDGVGLAITTPAGLIVHSGDYKFDQTPIDHWPSDFGKLSELGKRGVLVLLSDSTNAERPGTTPSEMDINKAFEEVFANAKGRVIISSFASLISRLQQVSTIARRHRRKICIVGTSMVDNVNLATKLGYIKIPEESLVSLEEALNLPDKDVLILCTGSQGEPTSILGRLSTGKYFAFSIKPGDTVVLSSHPIPGNEEDVSGLINRLYRMGANVIYSSVMSVHVSGHACQEEIKLLFNLVRPKYFIPVHGELRHLHQQAKIGVLMGIPEQNIAVVENGQTICFRNGRMRLGEQVPASMILVDGSNVGDINIDVMHQRERLAEGGVVMVTLLFDKTSGAIMKEPKIQQNGVIPEKEMTDNQEELKRIVIERCNRYKSSNKNNLEKDIEQQIRKYFYNSIHRSPWVIVNTITA